MHYAPGCGNALRELLQELGEAVEVGLAPRLARPGLL
jgi:hypothetical protein